MTTNMRVEQYPGLERAAKELLAAAHAFWLEHQKLGGPRAVVWLEDTSGHFIVFTRGEYKVQLLHNITPLSEETPLSGAFADAPAIDGVD